MKRKIMKNKMITATLIALILFTSLAACAAKTTSQALTAVRVTQEAGLVSVSTTPTAATSDNLMASVLPLKQTAEVSSSDTDTSWSSVDTQITLDGNEISVIGEGVEVVGQTATITSAGTYVVTGVLENGQIIIAALNTDKVHLVLNGVEITNQSGAPIYASQCDKLIVTLVEGTENTLADGGASFEYEDLGNEEPNAALFAKDDLTINGTGRLMVNGDFNNGIGSKDDLVIVNGEISVVAANHALRGNDSVTVLDGILDLTAANDGIQTNNTEDPSLGWVSMSGGRIVIQSGHDGIQADTTLTISGGDLLIDAAAGSLQSSTSDSYKGIKAGGEISIIAGNVNINSADDSIHASGNIIVSGGQIVLATEDDGVHSDANLTVLDGTITVTKSYEGLEAMNLAISGGTIDIVSSDDALNAAGGVDQSGIGGQFPQDRFAASGKYSIDISGGNISFYAGGDGIDSNGSIAISGGSLLAQINSSADNGAIDADGMTTFTGGTLAYGGTGTGAVPGDGSSQSYVFISSGVASGSVISIQKDGQVLMSVTPTVNCQYMAFSLPGIVAGESYEVYSGNSLVAEMTAGEGSSGMPGRPGGGMGGPGRR